jgi:hypothetical protein
MGVLVTSENMRDNSTAHPKPEKGREVKEMERG